MLSRDRLEGGLPTEAPAEAPAAHVPPAREPAAASRRDEAAHPERPAAPHADAAHASAMLRARPYGLLLLSALLFCVYTLSNSGRLHIIDEASLFAVTESLGLRGQVDTNAIAWTQWVNSPGEVLGAFGPDGEVYSKKGPAPAFLAVGWYSLLRGLTLIDIDIGLLQTTLLWNGLVTAFTAALLWLTAVRLGYRDRTGLLLALLFGLATIAWPYAEQFFGEPLSAAGLLLAFYGILSWRSSGAWGWMLAAGIAAGVAVATVTAHAVLVALLALYAVVVWLQRRAAARSKAITDLRAAAAFLLPILLAGLLLLAYNQARFGSPFATGYHFESGEGFTNPLVPGLWGLLFSPYRSLFLHTPLLLAGLVGFVPFVRRNRAEGILVALLSAALLVLYSLWWMWWGGYAWGPRFLVPMTPFWVLLLAPLVEGLAFRRDGVSLQTRLLSWGFVGLAALSFLVQLLAASINFVNYETMLRSEFFPTDWANPLAYGPPAQSLGDFFLSPIFGQLRLVARGGFTANSDLAWLWPDGHLSWTLVFVGALALATLGWLLVRWAAAAAERRYADAVLSPPMLGLLVAVPLITLGAFAGTISGEPSYGTPGQGYRAVIDEICTGDMPSDRIVTVAPFSYHIPMNWLPAACGRGLPVFGYAADSLAHPETRVVLERELARADRILFVTAGFAPNDPNNTIERWLAQNAYKADDRWFDDYRLLRYATPGKIRQLQFTTHTLLLTDGGDNRVTLVASRTPAAARPGEIIPVEIQYMLNVPAADDLRWFIQLLSPQGVAVAQLDTAPEANYTAFTALRANDLLMERAGLQLPVDMEPGSHQVIAGLYNPAQPGAPRLSASDGREYLVLATLAITE